ncbi:uncharacterized protein LOC129587017 [Paramacrobiotus metropolitanus]|uniref:uncharacterized protein LOC129587017 n=1 Tax=Paramacrobiotus metropolitanus TaxID=2943436 RepID=UPI00244591CD|nr:uncharacterized protein LOC129587017 [Paramacrobiotus metropolitanus]
MRIMDLCSHSQDSAASTRILVTHGTDTMIETGRYISERILRMPSPPVIVLTGALLPERFKDTDADFNVGMAIGALQCLTRPGVYIACTGQVIPVEHAERIIATGKFFNLLSSESKP